MVGQYPQRIVLEMNNTNEDTIGRMYSNTQIDTKKHVLRDVYSETK